MTSSALHAYLYFSDSATSSSEEQPRYEEHPACGKSDVGKSDLRGSGLRLVYTQQPGMAISSCQHQAAGSSRLSTSPRWRLCVLLGSLTCCDGGLLYAQQVPKRARAATIRPHLRRGSTSGPSLLFWPLRGRPRQLTPEEGSDPDAAAGRAADEQLDQEITEKNAARKQAAANAAAESGKPAAVPMAPYESEFRGSTSEFELFEDITQPYWRRDTRLFRVDPWAVGEPESNPEIGGLRSLGNVQWFRGLKDDFRRKAPLYISDWTDGLRNPQKSLAAISFLYFACLAPVVAFGGAMAGLTQGAMGVAEVIASCGVCGMLYSMIAGQPMTFVAPTGLTLAFTAALYRYCASLAVPFLPMYSWVGCWTSLILIFASTINASGLIRYCTRFTEDVFNALLAFNFLAEATRSITSEFRSAATTSDGLLAANCAMLTAVLLQMVSGFRSKRYLSQQVRETISDFGPPMIIIGVSALTLLPAVQALGSFSRLSLPGGFMLSGGRALLVPMLTLPWNYRLLALLPAIFLATLFFLDQNITVRTVNSPSHKLAKGAAYHMDLCALGILTFLASITGLPWMCSATVQSLNHVRAMTRYSKSTNKDGRESESPSSVVETRLTGFGVHAGVLASALVIPALSCVPLPVVAGVFLYLGKKVMSGNQFLRRCKQLFLDKKELSVTTEGEKEQVILGRPAVFRFTALQVLCLAVLWALKLSPSTALIFPSVIGVLMLVRVQLIPKLFTARELMLLDTAIGATSA